MRCAVIVAGGASVRFGQDKLQSMLLNESVLNHSVNTFLPIADAVVVVGAQVQGTLFAPAGATRFLSVLSGLQILKEHGCSGLVAVHDGARPFVTRQFVSQLYSVAEQFGSAVPYLPVTDTVWQRQDGQLATADRGSLFTVQTPQVFDLDKLLLAATQAQGDYTDESSLYSAFYGSVHFCEGSRANVKITYPSDLPMYRVGVGFDVHPFEPGDGVTLGGVKIPFSRKLKGHSDADALCHAVCDALLSATGEKDIGHFFPPDDDAYLGADSTMLLGKCVAIAAQSGYEPVNLSAFVVCEQPKISPYSDKIVRRLAQVLSLPERCVAIGATTSERLGALGRGDGIAAYAYVLMRRLDV